MASSSSSQPARNAAAGVHDTVHPAVVSVDTAMDVPPQPRDVVRAEIGADPDPRFTFANERTYLAWNRTALALIAGGLAAAQFLKAGFAGVQLIVALPLIALGATLSYRSYRHWQHNQQALRLAKPLPACTLPRVLGYGIGAFALAATTLAIIHFTSR